MVDLLLFPTFLYGLWLRDKLAIFAKNTCGEWRKHDLGGGGGGEHGVWDGCKETAHWVAILMRGIGSYRELQTESIPRFKNNKNDVSTLCNSLQLVLMPVSH